MSPADRIINYNDKLYVVKRTIWEHHSPIINTWKEHLGTETVLRKDGKLWFCSQITDAELIEPKIADAELIEPRISGSGKI